MAQYQSFPDAAGASHTLEKLKALRLPELNGQSFLDVGCNEGFFCGFARFQGARRVVGIDYGKSFIGRARQRFPDCEFLNQSWDQLPTGPFDVILLASALHYAEDQAELIRRLVGLLGPNGVLVLELGIVSSDRSEWAKVKRGIDERYFPTMPKLREILQAFAWKWMGPSVAQAGDPVSRHVIHISRRRPLAYLLMQPPGYGKSSITASLFPPAHVPVVSGDQKVLLAVQGKLDASAALREVLSREFSPLVLDQVIQRAFDEGLGGELVRLWAGDADGKDFALDGYVPVNYHDVVQQELADAGYLPVLMHWNRYVPSPLHGDELVARAEAFYMSLNNAAPDSAVNKPGEHVVVGFIDELQLSGTILRIRGWAIDKDGSLPAQLVAKIGGKIHVLDKIEKQLRPDVQSNLRTSHALLGFKASLALDRAKIRRRVLKGFEVWPARDGVPYGPSLHVSKQVADALSSGQIVQ